MGNAEDMSEAWDTHKVTTIAKAELPAKVGPPQG